MTGNPWHDELGRFTSKDEALDSYNAAIIAAEVAGDTAEAKRLSDERDGMLMDADPASEESQRLFAEKYSVSGSVKKEDVADEVSAEEDIADAFRSIEMGSAISINADADGNADISPALVYPEDDSIILTEDGELEYGDHDWSVVTGFSNSGNKDNGVMHPSEQIDGGPARYMAENPGVYSTLPVDDEEGEPVGWALLRLGDNADNGSRKSLEDEERAYAGDPYGLDSLHYEANRITDVVEAREFAKNVSAEEHFSEGESRGTAVKVNLNDDYSLKSVRVFSTKEGSEIEDGSGFDSRSETYQNGTRLAPDPYSTNVDSGETSLSDAEIALMDAPDDSELQNQVAKEHLKTYGPNDRVISVLDNDAGISKSTENIKSAIRKHDVKGISSTAFSKSSFSQGEEYHNHKITLRNREGKEVSLSIRSSPDGHQEDEVKRFTVADAVERAAYDSAFYQDVNGDYDEAANRLYEDDLDHLKNSGYLPEDETWRTYDRNKRHFNSIKRQDDNLKKFFGEEDWNSILTDFTSR